MKKLFVGGLALALLLTMSENAAAQEEKKMTREGYIAQMADLTDREMKANAEIADCNEQIAILKKQIAETEMANNDLMLRSSPLFPVPRLKS